MLACPKTFPKKIFLIVFVEEHTSGYRCIGLEISIKLGLIKRVSVFPFNQT